MNIKNHINIYWSELSSVGRAFDCSGLYTFDIKGSLVRFRQFGYFLQLFKVLKKYG